MRNVVFDKGGDKVVAMVVPRLQAQLDSDITARGTRCLQGFRQQLLLGEEAVISALVYQNVERFTSIDSGQAGGVPVLWGWGGDSLGSDSLPLHPHCNYNTPPMLHQRLPCSQ